MSRFEFLKSLLPIGIYFIAEYFFGAVWGMVAGVLLAVADMLRTYRGTKKVDRSFWIEIGMVLFFGVTTIMSEAEAVKPYSTLIISLFITSVLAFAVFTGFNILTLAGGKMMEAVNMDPFRSKLLNDSVIRMFIWSVAFTVVTLLFHIITVPPQIQFIEGKLVWMVLIFYFASEMIIARLRGRKYGKEEWLPIVNEEGKVVGRAPRSMFHNNAKWLHPVVHLHVITPEGLLLQKRANHKMVQPGKWDTAVGGHVSAGETLEKSLQREASEEIGLQVFEARLLKQYIWESSVERELVFMFVTQSSGPFTPEAYEVDELKSWRSEELKTAVGKGLLTPNLEQELDTVLQFL